MDVSVIIPMYNVELKIEQAIKSVLKQTIIDSIEILCIDDESTDNTIKKVKEINADNIHIYCQQHLGAGPARNFGISKSTGRYIAFLDADDEFVDEDALEKMVRAADEHNVFICGSLRKVVDNGEEKESELFNNYEISKHGLEICYLDFQKNYDYQSFIFKKQFLEDNNIRFPDYKRYQDPPFMVKAMSIADKFYVVPVYLYRYYFDGNKTTLISRNIEDVLKGIRDCAEIAYRNKYIHLMDAIETQLNQQFRDAIISNMNTAVGKLLFEISNFYRVIKDEDIHLVKDMLNTFKIQTSNDLMRRLVLIDIYKVDWNNYFSNRGIKSVVIYGLGTYGEILIRILERCHINILYAIDRNKKEFGSIPVYANYRDISCDAIIISLAEPGEILEQFDNNGNNVISFRGMIMELSQNLI
jgi:glycosyltransferase involved in cell wall biosynthesis